MQKPTIEHITFADGIQTYHRVIDTDGKEYIYICANKAKDFHQSELAKWEAEQEPQVLFESETVKVMKFSGQEQFEKWVSYLDNKFMWKGYSDYDFSLPILIIYYKEVGWWAIDNITTDLIQAVQSVNVATIKQAENYRSDKCECGCLIDYKGNFCPNCGKTIKDVEQVNKYQGALNHLYDNATNGEPLCVKEKFMKSIEESKNDLQELVDRATPKKPIIVKLGDLIGGNDFHLANMNGYRCPICQNRVAFGCCCPDNNCRQAIDWER